MAPSCILVAPDSFKGTFAARDVAAAVGRGLQAAGLEHVDLCPIADGGEGTQDALLLARGGERVAVTASDPLGRPVHASFALLPDGTTAVVEVAQASGLGLVAEAERDAEAASSAGTGELVAAAVARGAREILVAAGGSATTDGGAGALAAIEAAGGLGGARLTVLCDVRTPFERAADIFAPQKGADPDAVARLSARLDRLAEALPRDPRGLPLTGAAGGLAGGLWATLRAQLVPGAVAVLDALRFDERMRAATAVVTGEGRIDAQTLEGKAVGEVAVRCRQAGVPAFAVAGTNRLDAFYLRLLDLECVIEASTEQALERAGRALADVLPPGWPPDGSRRPGPLR